jgi:hypothetical protein
MLNMGQGIKCGYPARSDGMTHRTHYRQQSSQVLQLCNLEDFLTEANPNKTLNKTLLRLLYCRKVGQATKAPQNIDASWCLSNTGFTEKKHPLQTFKWHE